MPITKKPKKRLKKQVTLDCLKRAGVFYSNKLKRNSTKWELIFKSVLDKNNFNYIFQHPIICNQKKLYIIDFYFPEYQIAIEIDGYQYHSTKVQIKADNLRTKRIKAEGIKVRRLTNKQVTSYKEDALLKITKMFLNIK